MAKVFDKELRKMADKIVIPEEISPSQAKDLARRYVEYSWVLDRIKRRKNKIILDAGCGASPLPFLLAIDGARVFALDINWPSQDILEITFHILFSLYPRYNFSYINCDIANTPFKNEYFDYITCVSVFQTVNVAKWNKIIKELTRILKSTLLVTADYKYTSNKLPIAYEGLELQEKHEEGTLQMLAFKKRKS